MVYDETKLSNAEGDFEGCLVLLSGGRADARTDQPNVSAPATASRADDPSASSKAVGEESRRCGRYSKL
jgi:hypothetical protein